MSKTYAIGDLHGRLDVLEACLERIDQHREGAAKIVFLGDYIDRGPHSREVVERLMAGSVNDIEWITLGGNHEDMCLMAYEQPDSHMSWWVTNGGGATLASYPDRKVEDRHLHWMSKLETTYLDAHRLYVHAGVMRDIPLEKQSEDHLRWVRYGRDVEAGVEGYYVVHGHTPYMDGPVVLESRCNLDTLAYKTGRAAIGVFDDDLPGQPVEMLTVNCGYGL